MGYERKKERKKLLEKQVGGGGGGGSIFLHLTSLILGIQTRCICQNKASDDQYHMTISWAQV